MLLDTNNHSVFKLRYCLVLTTYQNYPLINKDISEELKIIFERISVKYKVSFEELKYEECNIKLFFSAYPTTDLSKFVNAYKSASSRIVKKMVKDDNFDTSTSFWEKSYCLLTKGSLDENFESDYIMSRIKKGR